MVSNVYGEPMLGIPPSGPVISFLAPLLDEGGHDGGSGGGCDDSDQDEGEWNIVDGTNESESLVGSEGRDSISGFNGNDELYGKQGADKLFGGNGGDFLDGGEGRDFLYGGNDNDELRGGKGKDNLYGENGNDILIGGCGPDLLDGGRGDDILDGGNSPDTMTGGLGSDIFVLRLPGEGGGHGGGGGESGHSGSTGGESGTDDGHAEADIITDFKQGVDHLALAGGLSFGSLSLAGEKIFATGEESRLLAILTGFNTNLLTSADFVFI